MVYTMVLEAIAERLESSSLSARTSLQQKELMRTTKTTATFRLSKRTKTLLALSKFKNEDQRNAFRRMMIDAQVASSMVIKSSKDRNSNKGE